MIIISSKRCQLSQYWKIVRFQYEYNFLNYYFKENYCEIKTVSIRFTAVWVLKYEKIVIN
jgi:hypothetical protein